RCAEEGYAACTATGGAWIDLRPGRLIGADPAHQDRPLRRYRHRSSNVLRNFSLTDCRRDDCLFHSDASGRTRRSDHRLAIRMIGSKDQNMNDFESVIPILSVKNFTASIDYYVNKLGFEKRWDWGDPPTFGCVGRGKIDIFLCEGAQGQPGM